MTTLRTIYGLPVVGEADSPAQLVSNMHIAMWGERFQQQGCTEHGLDLHDRFVPLHRTIIRRRCRRSKAGRL